MVTSPLCEKWNIARVQQTRAAQAISGLLRLTEAYQDLLLMECRIPEEEPRASGGQSVGARMARIAGTLADICDQIEETLQVSAQSPVMARSLTQENGLTGCRRRN